MAEETDVQAEDFRYAQTAVRRSTVPSASYEIETEYNIKFLGYIPPGINFQVTQWQMNERIDALNNNIFPEQFMLATNILHIHEQGNPNRPLDCSLWSEGESMIVEVLLPSVKDVCPEYFQYKAGVRFQNRWKFFDIDVVSDGKKGQFRTNKIESLSIFTQAIKEKTEILVEGMQYVNTKDKRINVKFPPNSVTNSKQIDFKVYPAKTNNIKRTIDVNEIGIFKISNCLFGSHLDFQVPVSVQLPMEWIDRCDITEDELEYLIFKVNDEWSLEFVDTKVEIEQDKATFTVNSFSGVGCVAAARGCDQADLRRNVQIAFQAIHMAETICKILFFVQKQEPSNTLMIMLECVKIENVMDVISKRKESYDFDIVREWTSKDVAMIPDKTIIKVDVRGMFSMPRGIQCKSPAISFNPNVKENFTRFRVLLSPRLGIPTFGILSMRDIKGVIDEISFDPITYFHHNANKQTGRAVKQNAKKYHQL